MNRTAWSLNLGVARRAVVAYGIEDRVVHFDTTSKVMYGDYEFAEATPPPIRIVNRYSAETDRVIRDAVSTGVWEEVGALARTRPTKNRPAAHYRICEQEVVLYGTSYRAVVVHSTAHDGRRRKRQEKDLERFVEQTGQTLDGWDKKRTDRPTAFMLSIKFAPVQVVRLGSLSKLLRPLSKAQLEWLAALNLTPSVFLGLGNPQRGP